MLRANLYEMGKDPDTDRAIALSALLDSFVSQPSPDGVEAAFETLRAILMPAAPAGAEAKPA